MSFFHINRNEKRAVLVEPPPFCAAALTFAFLMVIISALERMGCPSMLCRAPKVTPFPPWSFVIFHKNAAALSHPTAAHAAANESVSMKRMAMPTISKFGGGGGGGGGC
jgi:hypothetical protein